MALENNQIENSRIDNDEISFTSKMNWKSLKLGPESAINPKLKKTDKEDGDEDYSDM